MNQKMEINRLLKQFYEISGFRVSIHDREFHEIYAYPAGLLPFCRQLQTDRCVRQTCLFSDAQAFRKAEETGEPFIYRCEHGLYEAVTPLYRFGVVSGYLMIGQGLQDTGSAKNIFLKSAYSLDVDRETAEKLIRNIPTATPQKLNAYLDIMTVLAEYITQTDSLPEETNLPERIRTYIGKNYGEKITLETLSEKFGCCRSTLTQSFRREFGRSIMDYVTHVRMCAAIRYLKNSTLSVKEIAMMCGFDDQNYFSRIFSERYGCSPTEYRKKDS